MRIKSSLVLSIVASLLVSTVIAGAAFFILRSMRIELERSRVYDEAMIKANALNVLLASLPEGSNASDLLQIRNVQASLNDLLDKMASMDALEESLIRQIKRENETLRFLLDQVSVSGPGGRMVLDRERKEILDSQLWMKVRRIYDELYRLRVKSRSRIDAAQANAGITVLFLLVSLIFSNTLISVLSGRKVVQSEESLRQSEENFRSLYNRTPVMLHSINPEGKIISVSDYWLETMGYAREEVLGRHITDFLTPGSRREALEVNLPRFMQTGYARDIEYQFVKKNGEIMDALLSAILEKDAAGAMVRTMGVVVDVTARQRAEAALQESEALLREAQRIAHIGSWSVTLQDHSITWSDEMYRLYGVTKEAFPHTVEAFMTLLHPDDRPLMERWLEATTAQRHPGALDSRIVLPDGTVRYIQGQGELITDRAGNPERLTGTAQDITERQQAEAERDRLFTLSIDMLCIAGFDGFFKQVNPAWEKTLGWTGQELLSQPWLELVHPEDRAATIAAGAQLVTGEAVYAFENRYQCRDGSYRWVSWNSFPLLAEGLIFCVARDITDRKQAEAALLREKTLSDTIIESLPGVFYLFDAQGKYLRWNDKLEQLTGYTGADFAGMEAWDLFRGADRERTAAAFQEALQLGEVTIEAELSTTDGGKIPHIFTGRRVEIGDTTCVVGVGIDITARQQAEAALLREKTLSDTIIESLPGIFYLYDEQLRFSRVNRRFEEVTGYTAAEIANLSPLDFFTGPDKELLAQRIQQVFTEGQAEVEALFVTKAGDQIPYHFTGARMTLGGQNYLEGVGVDITKRKQAEAALRQSEELYRSLFDNMLNGFAYCKMLFEGGQPQDYIYLSVNRSFETLTGLHDVVGVKVTEIIPGIREADPELFEILGRVALTGQPERFEIYLEALKMWFALAIYSPAKEYFVAVFDVITERKQAEAALEQQFHDLAALYAASQAFLVQIGVDETLTQACRLAVEQFKLKLAWVGLITPADYLVRPAAVWGEEAGYIDQITVTWDEDSPTSQGPGGRAIRSRLAAVTNRIETEPTFAPWREAAQVRGFRSNVALPMLFGGEVLGAIALYSETPYYFNPDLVQVLQGFANQVAVALQKARFYEETQRYAGELEDRVAERTAQLESTNQELDRFAYSVSHDLRAPLRAMQGFSLALLEDYAGALDPGGQDYARRINAAAERMDRLIQDLLAYSRISREEMALQPVSLEQAVAEAVAHVEGDIQARQARVRVEPPLPEVQANRAALLQIVANLVSNAIKFTAPGVQPQVRLWAEDRGPRVRLWVEDNGLGIAPEHLERIFRIFERLHGIEAYPGTGIGLAIVKKGVERMGGQVGVESELGQGSRFWVELEKAV